MRVLGLCLKAPHGEDPLEVYLKLLLTLAVYLLFIGFLLLVGVQIGIHNEENRLRDLGLYPSQQAIIAAEQIRWGQNE